MKVSIYEFVEGARKARGLTVIIDVFRAFSVACYAMDAGIDRLIVTDQAEKARMLKGRYKNTILIGERDEKKIEGFDLGNSPTEIIRSNLTGMNIIQTTTAGTNGLLNADNSDIIITGSLVNASAVIKYIKSINPVTVSLVAMGYRATISAEEDLLCAEIIKAGLESKYRNFDLKISDLKNTSGKRFFLPENIDFSPPTDFFLCTMTDRFNFILKAVKRYDGNMELVRIEI